MGGQQQMSRMTSGVDTSSRRAVAGAAIGTAVGYHRQQQARQSVTGTAAEQVCVNTLYASCGSFAVSTLRGAARFQMHLISVACAAITRARESRSNTLTPNSCKQQASEIESA